MTSPLRAVHDEHYAMRRYDAYCELMAKADPIDLPARGRHYVCAGDPARRETLKRYFANAWVRHRMQAYGEDVSIVSVRRSPLRLVKRA